MCLTVALHRAREYQRARRQLLLLVLLLVRHATATSHALSRWRRHKALASRHIRHALVIFRVISAFVLGLGGIEIYLCQSGELAAIDTIEHLEALTCGADRRRRLDDAVARRGARRQLLLLLLLVGTQVARLVATRNARLVVTVSLDTSAARCEIMPVVAYM